MKSASAVLRGKIPGILLSTGWFRQDTGYRRDAAREGLVLEGTGLYEYFEPTPAGRENCSAALVI